LRYFLIFIFVFPFFFDLVFFWSFFLFSLLKKLISLEISPLLFITPFMIFSILCIEILMYFEGFIIFFSLTISLCTKIVYTITLLQSGFFDKLNMKNIQGYN